LIQINDALRREGIARERHVEGRIEERAQGFLKDDGHGWKSFLERDGDNMRGGSPSRQGARSGCPPRQPAVRRTDFRDRPVPTGNPLRARRMRIQHARFLLARRPCHLDQEASRLSRSMPARYKISAAR
jgi:hypothetical protein